MDFAIPANHRVNIKQSEKTNEYTDLARELKKQWGMRVTMIPIVDGTVSKGLEGRLVELEIR